MLTFQMRLVDGTPADPPTFVSAVPNWRIGDPVRIGGDVRYTITGMSYDATSDMTTRIVMPVESGESAA
jgi:hypothetical protein